MIYVKAFLVGGIICALTQIFVDKTKLMPGRIMVGLVVIGAILGALGWYDKLVDFAGAGASVPISSFGNTLWNGVKDDIDANGFTGIFTGGFTAGSVGITAAIVFGYLASLVFQPRMKE
jgi:stage V sporulation protein AE